MNPLLLFRSAWRTLRVVGYTLIGFGFTLLGHVLRPVAPRFAVRLRNRAMRWWGRRLMRSFAARVHVEGTPPAGPCFLVTNHVSYLDIPLVASCVDAAFVGKAELRTWPVAGTVMTAADTVYIDRSRKRDLLRVLEQVDAAMARGLNVVLFPEGTSGRGDSLLPFKPSLLQFAVEKGLPVHWATIEYRTPDGEPPPSRAVCWWGDEALAPHYPRLMRLPWLEAVLRFGDEPVRADDRKQLALELRAAMLERFQPMP
ncbi:MAG: lysophospholipid acyltransferase family protein [Acidobacteriota bacterium]